MSTFTRIDKFTSLYVEPCHENVTIQRAHISALRDFPVNCLSQFSRRAGVFPTLFFSVLFEQTDSFICILNKLNTKS